MQVGGKGDHIPIATIGHHQNGFCIKVGSDESYFNVSLVVKDKVTRRCPQTRRQNNRHVDCGPLNERRRPQLWNRKDSRSRF